jgi:gamma-glutamyl-gamma-aminobutyrate hydrolase PuuD
MYLETVFSRCGNEEDSEAERPFPFKRRAKVCIVDHLTDGWYDMFAAMYESRGFSVTTDISDADLVQFVGGVDVDPRLYGEWQHHRTMDPYVERDKTEAYIFNYCMAHDIRMVGVCRGAQFLNVMCGGSLWQDVDNHGKHHRIFPTFAAGAGGKTIMVNSTHHQMMKPSEVGQVLYTAQESTHLEGMNSLENDVVEIVTSKEGNEPDVEVVLYNNVLCVQYHPEFPDCPEEGVDAFFQMIADYLYLHGLED